MAKPLATILKKYSDVISGKLPASEVSKLTTGKEPGVDYASKMPDEREFVASHSVEKHPDRNGNGDDVFKASKIKQTSAEGGKHGYIPDPKDERVYKQANEETDSVNFNKTSRGTTLAERVGQKYGKVNEKKDNREYDYEGEMAVTQLKTIMRHAEHLMKMMEPNTNLPEWVQSKITKAQDYISTAHDYLMSEMNEAKRDMSGMVCEACGDHYGKPTNESCKYDSHDMNGKNWVKKEQDSAADKEPRYTGKKKEGRQLITDKNLQEKAESVAQQKIMAMALAYKRGEMKDASPEVKKLADSMTEKQLRDYATTKHKGLPQKAQKVAKESAPADTPITFPVTNSREGFGRL